MEDYIKEVPGSRGAVYKVNLKEVTCTCRDWGIRRRHHEVGNTDRYCKHLKPFNDEILNQKTSSDGKVRYPRADFELAITAISEIQSMVGDDGIEKMECCGSWRRGKDMVHDIDFVVLPRDVDKMNAFFDKLLELGAEKLWRGNKKFSCKFGKLQVDFLITDEISFPFATLHYTGSKAHNIKLRGIAKKMGLTLSEYYFGGSEPQRPASELIYKTERDIFNRLGVEYLEPENR